jgi:ABC-2 type transport system permease protein
MWNHPKVFNNLEDEKYWSLLLDFVILAHIFRPVLHRSKILLEHKGREDFILQSVAISKAVEDIQKSFLSSSLWLTLGWQDIKQRYRRSVLGPFWITLSLGITILVMGFLYAKLFRQDIRMYIPYLASGMVFWSFISTVINESTTVFIQAEGIIKQIPMPFGIHVLRMIWRNVIIFFHNLVVLAVVMIVFHVIPGRNILLLPMVLFMLVLNSYWIGILLGVLGTRFRDIVQIVASIVQILFFLTPVMWTSSSIQHNVWVVEFNPFYHVFTIARNAVLGGNVPITSWAIVLLMTLVGWAIAFHLLARYRARIAYWL